MGGYMRGLYIHIPFCNSLCKFCDFPKRIKQNQELKKAYLNKLIKDLNKLNSKLCFDTVYIGGGTPNSISLELLESLFKEVKKLHLNPNLEYTIECNFELITEEQVKLFKQYGINRVSFGIQTFNPKIGKYINRQSNFKLCQEKISLLNNYGIENINADFIFGLPYQSLKDVKDDLLLISKLNLKHVSYYSLILEDRSVLGYEIKENKITLPDIDLAADMYELIQKELPKMGYSQYEISNFCKDGYESKHNKIYWELDDYYGIGMSAASYNNNKRYTNSRLINEYLNDENITNDEVYLGEFFFLGLRLTKGVSLQKFYEKYQIDPYQKYPINELIDKGLVVVIDDYLKLTPLGLDNGNLVFEAFI